MTLTREQLDLARTCGELLEQTYPGGSLKPNVVSRETDTQALVTELTDGRFAVIIPGTASGRDVLTDINIIKTQNVAGYVHAGVGAAWKSISQGVLKIVPPQAEVVLSGHSLGAGIVQEAAFRFGNRVSAVVTFGGLRVFNGAAAKFYNSFFSTRTLRFVNQGDPVPHFPLPLPIPRTGIYTHTAGEIYLREDGGFETDRPWYATALPLCTAAASLLAGKLNPALLDFVSVPAHFMTSYNARLKGLTA